MNYKVMGINSGLGVSLFPFKKRLVANFECRGVFHTPKNEQWKANFGGIPLFKDINPDNLTPYIGTDVIISSPDCGSGSIFRYSRSKELGDHTNNASLQSFFTSLHFIKPKFFLFENLEGLFKSFPKERFEELTDKYRLIIHNDSVCKWGNSQINRKRLIIVGVRKDISKRVDKYFKLPNIENQQTCKELYGDLKYLENHNLCHVREDIFMEISIHARKKMTLKEIQKTWQNRLSGQKRWKTEPGFKFTTAPGVYRNLDNSFPATARKANRQYDHNGLTLTPRQLARIQGVPDSFVLFYQEDRSGYWINKGRCIVTKTPPMEISIWFKRKLEKGLKALARQKR